MLAAAFAAFQEGSYEAATMNDVARRAGVVKGTLYLYYASKESLFFDVLIDQLDQWFDALEEALEAASSEDDADDVPAVLARTLAQRPGMCRLLAILHTHIEPKLDRAQRQDFTARVVEQLSRGADLLASHLPGVDPGRIQTLMRRTHVFTVGLVQLAGPAIRPAPETSAVAIPAGLDLELELGAALRDCVAAWSLPRSSPEARAEAYSSGADQAPGFDA